MNSNQIFDGIYERLTQGRLNKTIKIAHINTSMNLLPYRDNTNGWVYVESLDTYKHYVFGVIHCDFGPAVVWSKKYVFVFASSEVSASLFMNVYNKRLLASIGEL